MTWIFLLRENLYNCKITEIINYALLPQKFSLYSIFYILSFFFSKRLRTQLNVSSLDLERGSFRESPLKTQAPVNHKSRKRLEGVQTKTANPAWPQRIAQNSWDYT